MSAQHANKPQSGTSRRGFLKASTTSILLGASGSLAAPFVSAKSKTTLRILNNETSAASQKVWKEASAEYEKKFGIKTTIDSASISSAYPKVLAAAKSGNMYDISTQSYVADLLSYVDAGMLVPLTDMIKTHSWGRFGPWQYKGENWFYPYDYNLVTMYYRKDLYEQHHLSVPNTWNQLLENCKTLATYKDGQIDRGGCVLPLQSDTVTNWASLGCLLAQVPKFYNDKWEVTLDQGDDGKSAAAFLDLYAELFKVMPAGMNTAGYGELMNLFVTERTAHSVYSGRLVESIERNNPSLAGRFGIFALPDIKGERQALPYAADGFLVFKTKQSEEATKFLKWFIDNYYIDWLHSAWMNFQPVRLDIYEDKRWKDFPPIKKYWDIMAQMKSYIEPDNKTLITSVDTSGPTLGLPPCKVFLANVMPEMLQDKVLKQKSSAECVSTAADKMRKLS